MAKKLTLQQKSERGRSERRQIGQKQRKDRKEEAAIAKANAMLDKMMRDGTIIKILKKQKI
jgi:ABC-type amino acid transport substrate-binding protein